MSTSEPPRQPQRLQKVLAAAGVGSRRSCEELITAGRVSVNGEVTTRLGVRADPDHDVIHVDGARIVLDKTRVYWALNKPSGVVSTMADERARMSVAEFIRPQETRVFHVGRLDTESEGLLLLTNDGELSHRLTHPSFGVEKTYICEVEGVPPRSTLRQLTQGVSLEDGLAAADAVRVRDTVGKRSMVEIKLHIGKNRIVRRMMESVGYPVQRLIRTHFGPVRLGQLPSGSTRELTLTEVGELYRVAGL